MPTREDLYLRYLTEKGIKERFNGFDVAAFDPKWAAPLRFHQIRDRVEHELLTLEKAGFAGYFLVVADILRFCRASGIPTGPGRGSICGSLVAYATRITDVDPLKFDIPFERFLHLERIAQPDIDLDICQVRRGEVIQYLRNTYGSESVAQIITFTPLNAKGVVRDVCRVLHVDEVLRGIRNNETGEKLALMIPEGSGADQIKLQEHIDSDEGKEFKQKIEKLIIPFEGEDISVLDTCLTLEGIQRHGSVHAAGVVIADRPLIDLVPLYRKNQESEPQTQFDMRDCETLGLLKMDVLGLRTVTVIGDAEKMIRELDPNFHVSNIPLDDSKTFDLIGRGDTDGVFQLEGEGITNAAKGMRPDKFDDIIALISLYRPGPMEQLGDYFDRKHGKQDVAYVHPDLKPILERSYGLIVYQEQVMGIVRTLGGYTAGEADMFRKAIGKKLVPLIKEKIDEFAKRANDKGHAPEIVRAICDQIFYFGRYGFNLGHATGYAFLTYWTAYLKANYPLEFYTANLNSYVGTADKIGSLLRDAERHDIVVYPPDINASQIQFSIRRGANSDSGILFGIGAIKGVGDSTVTDIIEYRDNTERNEYSSRRIDKNKSDGTPYKANVRVTTRVRNEPRQYAGFWDFCRRHPRINIGIKRALISAGCFGSAETTRSELLYCAESINDNAKLGREYNIPVGANTAIPAIELLRGEKDVLGFYITSHPLGYYKQELQRYDATIDGTFEDLESNTIGGLVVSIRTHMAKNGEMAWVTLESGISDLPEITMFNSIWKDVKNIVEKDAVLVIQGKKEFDARFGWSFKANNVTRIEKARPDAELIHISMPSTDVMDLLTLKKLSQKDGALVQIAIGNIDMQMLLTTNVCLQPTGALIAQLEEMGWMIKLDPDPDAILPWWDDKHLVKTDSEFVGFGTSRIPVWESDLARQAAKILDSRVISNLRVQ